MKKIEINHKSTKYVRIQGWIVFDNISFLNISPKCCGYKGSLNIVRFLGAMGMNGLR